MSLDVFIEKLVLMAYVQGHVGAYFVLFSVVLLCGS